MQKEGQNQEKPVTHPGYDPDEQPLMEGRPAKKGSLPKQPRKTRQPQEESHINRRLADMGYL